MDDRGGSAECPGKISKKKESESERYNQNKSTTPGYHTRTTHSHTHNTFIKMADDQLHEHLDTVKPCTHKKPYLGLASDKYSTNTETCVGKSILISNLKISVSGRCHILFNDLALVPEKWHLEEDDDGNLGIDLDNDGEEESTTTTIPEGSGSDIPAIVLSSSPKGGDSDIPVIS